MLNFHLGVPGLFPEFLQSLAESAPVRAAEHLHIVHPTEYQTLFLEAVNSRAGIWLESAETLKRIAEFAQKAAALNTVAISQHNFFGRAADALRPRKAFPLAQSRVERLSGFLGTCDMTFHLAIASQVEYILRMRRMSESDRLKAICDAQFSWSELVFRIRRGAPDRHLVVWDFDLPQAVVLPFVEVMLGIRAHDMKQQILETILPGTIPIGSGQIDYSNTTLEMAVARLDERYELDLYDIERMDGVTLVRHEMISPDLHLW